MSYETEAWPFVEAKWYTKIPLDAPRRVRLIVMHDMEFDERADSAEVIAHDFATRSETEKASAHLCIDCDSTIQCVHDRDVAYAAPGANRDGIHLELAGFRRQSRADWLDRYSLLVLLRAADAVAQYCLKYSIPPQRLSNEQLRAGQKGIVGHDQVSAVYKQSDHTDPGPNFPWDVFLEHVLIEHARRSAP